MSARLYGVSIAAMLALVVSQFANGQVTTQTQAVPTGDLTEIIVTARRVEERAQDVPISMSIFTQRTLSDRNVTTSGDLAAITPSMSVDSEFGQDLTSFSIRGFVQTFIMIPAQVLLRGRQLVLRLLAWRPTLPTFFRLLDAL